MTYKALTEVKRKYYKYVSAPWTRPNLSENGTMGGDSFAVKASSEQTAYGRSAYCAVDGNSSTGWAASSASCWIEFYNPNPLNVTNIFFTNFDAYYPATLELYGCVDENDINPQTYNYNFVQIPTTVTTGVNGNTIDCSSNTNFYKIYKIQFPSTRAYGAKEITITATQKVAQESTSSDYDFYRDAHTYNANIKVVRKYYKYVSASWTRPNLFANGTIGGDSFAVKASSEQTAYGEYAWKAVDGDMDTAWGAEATSGNWYEFYNPNALNVTNITFSPADWYYPLSVELWAGNDENSLTQLSGFTYTASVETDGCVLHFSSNTNFYKIYRIYSDRNFYIKEFKITATQGIIQESTSSDYDFYRDAHSYDTLEITT